MKAVAKNVGFRPYARKADRYTARLVIGNKLHPEHIRAVPGSDAIVEGLYCKRPILCLTSSEILTPPPPPLVRREEILAGWRGGGGQ
jgi:hypothetical protein